MGDGGRRPRSTDATPHPRRSAYTHGYKGILARGRGTGGDRRQLMNRDVQPSSRPRHPMGDEVLQDRMLYPASMHLVSGTQLSCQATRVRPEARPLVAWATSIFSLVETSRDKHGYQERCRSICTGIITRSLKLMQSERLTFGKRTCVAYVGTTPAAEGISEG
ncbi:hypothetical protein BD311DRAFT_756825 [Dichomitus squalens]|uniref:Uncharacterized protein n=1 Tax=Dichomitus squalens TaxID=114155 RepID=A0A4Q9MQ01_9APHY|nr:hypothetical protein BD311DRAFT_756825 [Dichomitus squalens]